MRPWKFLMMAACGALAFAAVGCSMVVNSGELTEGCGDGKKVCETSPDVLACVTLSNVEYGCGSDDCSPCAIPNAVPRCSKSGECVVATCEGTYFDCDGSVDNGCEYDLARDEQHCGSCGNVCDLDNAAAVCSSGQCLVSACFPNFFDCDGDASNGCECSGGCTGEVCQ